MAGGPTVWAVFRSNLQERLAEDAKRFADLEPFLVKRAGAVMQLPFEVAEYTDFYASRDHAQNVGTMFRGAENALPPNWLSIPIGYNGRASTVVVSGTPITRPMGQLKAPDAALPAWGPTKRLDIELELGAIVGRPTQMGDRLTVAQADEHIFGYVLLNDWSARDIQAWEYQPLGPFQAKAFATSISPWVVTSAALAPFRAATPTRERPLLDYLHEPRPMLYNIELGVTMQPAGGIAKTICQTNYANMYYSAAQQLAHHASSGCKMRVGDLLGSGTISGPERDQCGSLLELTWGGRNPIDLGGTTRCFIEDGDTMTLNGHAQAEDYRIGFGSCVGTIAPAR